MGLTVIIHRRQDQLGLYDGWGSTQATGSASPSNTASGQGSWGGGWGTTQATGSVGGTGQGVWSSNTRELSLQVKGGFYGVGVYLNKEEDQIRNLLNSKGWSVKQVTQTSGSGIAGQGTRTFLVVVEVTESVSDSQVITGLRNTLTTIMSSPSVSIIRSTAVYVDPASPNAAGTNDWLSSLFGGVGTGVGAAAGAAFPISIGLVAVGLLALVIVRKL
jgi:hypothetical protein